jgi:hypothetical protein
MIGFDRPLRPRWIYDTLLLAEPNQKLSELNKPFENIARELTGKEGKRKARTVLFRCFLRDDGNNARVKSSLILKDFSSQHDFSFMVPIYLFYLIGKTSVLYRISDYLFRLYGFDTKINASFLKDKLINLYGDRDVVARSVRSFLKTLIYFDVAENKKNISLKRPLKVGEEQFSLMIKLFSKEIIRTPQIALNDLPKPIFNYFELPDIRVVAQKKNGKYWEYQQRANNDFLVVY